jgi:RHS repeat-associated protein
VPLAVGHAEQRDLDVGDVNGDGRPDLMLAGNGFNGRYQSILINRAPWTPSSRPTITSAPVTAGLADEPYVYDVEASDPDAGDVLTFSFARHPHGMSIDPATGAIGWTPAQAQRGVHEVRVRVLDQSGLAASQTFMITVGPLGPSPTPTPGLPTVTPTPTAVPTVPPDLESIVVEPDEAIILTGESQQFTATGVRSDGTAIDLTTLVAWSSGNPSVATVGAGGLAQPTGAGTTEITATAGAISDSATLTVAAFVASDSTDPVAEITSPANGADVTHPVDVIGTATDANFLKYELEIAPAGETAFTLLALGDATVSNGVLGQLDPTLLINDQYTLRLTVFDRGGNETVAEIGVAVSREMKIGHFTLSFEDVAIPLSGIPLGVVRTYDSRDKRTGDFGVGWRLDLRTVRVRANRVLGTGWVREQFGATIALQPLDAHRVTVTLPDGRIEQFDLALSPTSGLGSLDFTTVTGFTPRPGATGRLEALADPNLAILNAGVEDELVHDGNLATYDPQLFRYTMLDGTQLEIHRTLGVQKVVDPNGNTVTFASGSITHSSGEALTLTRDAQNRITEIVDGAGRTHQYAYDARGDLVSHTDPEDSTTEFRYDRNHNVIQIIDPLGRPVARNEYDDDGRLIASTDAKGNRSEIEHDLAGNREVLTDRLGRTTTLIYDDEGNVLSSTDPLGKTSLFTYDDQGNRLTSTDPLGRTTTYTYDDRRNVESVEDPLGHTTYYTYDDRGGVLTTTNARGHTTIQTFDAGGKPDSLTDPLGHTTMLDYDADGSLLSVTDPLGHTVENQYDTAGRRTKIIKEDDTETGLGIDDVGNLLTQSDAGGLTQTMTYDGRGRLATIARNGIVRTLERDAAGQATSATTTAGQLVRFTYDELGQPTQVLRPDDSVALALAYDDEGNVTSQTGAAGDVTEHVYDDADRIIATRYPDGSTEEREYDDAGQLIKVIDAFTHATEFEYDLAGRLIRTVDALGGEATQEYDEVGNLIAETDTLGRRTEYAYDEANRLITTTFPDGAVEQRTWDDAGKLASIVNPAGKTRSFGYDPAGRMVSVIDELGHETTYEHDVAARTRAVIDANGHRTEQSFDNEGRLLTTTRPGGETDTITYDAFGRIATKTNGNGETITYTYTGASGLPSKLELPGGAEETYTFEPDGLIASVTDARGTTEFDYDPATRRLTRATEPDGRYVRAEYDALGHRTVLAHAAGAAAPESVTTYDYDELGRLVEVTDPDAGVTTYTLDAVGQQRMITHPNGTTTEIDYDLRGRVTSIVHRDLLDVVIESFIYTLDDLGNRTVEERADGSRVEYDYDDASRVVEERRFDSGNVQTGVIGYVYDPVGNVIERTGDLGPATFTYDDNDQLLSGDGVTYAYDDAGNQVSATIGPQVTGYEYDARGRLVRFEPPVGTATDYTYDHDGNRQSSSGPGGTVDYLVDRGSPSRLSQVVRETGTAGATLREYVHGTTLLSETDGLLTSYRHVDGLGSTRALSNVAGVATDEFEYSAYGRTLAHGGVGNPAHRFAGERQDTESGLYQLRARYYDPRSGRFLSRDPAAGEPDNPLSQHDYLYALANPVNLTDPSGRSVPTTLAEALTVFRTQMSLRFEQFKSFVRGERKVADATGDIAQRVGAGLGILALGEETTNPHVVRLFFGNIVPGFNTFQNTVGGSPAFTAFGLGGLGEMGQGLFTSVASGRLFQTIAAMLTQNLLYKIEDLRACRPNDAAVAVQPVPPAEKYVELCPNFFKLDTMPTGKEKVLGGFTDASMTGVMVHEWTHLTFRAKDEDYLCRVVQKLVGFTAVNNADSYRCWVEYSYIGDWTP